MRIFLITLPGSEKRLENLKKNFPRYFEKFTIFQGVNGNELPVSEYLKLISPAYRRFLWLLTPAEVGCALSHMKVYEKMIGEDYEYAMVLEDDVIGSDEAIERIEQLIPNVIKTFGDNFVWILGGMEGGSTKYLFLKKTDFPEVYLVRKISRRHVARTVAYIVTKQTAIEILNKQRKCLIPADVWDELISYDTEILFSNFLKHPETSDESVIEPQRRLGSLPQKQIAKVALRNRAIDIIKNSRVKIYYFLFRLLNSTAHR